MGRHAGNYLTLTYIFVKLLYIANAIGQLFLLNIFIGHEFSFIGIKTIKHWLNNHNMTFVERFPRITICKFTIRRLGDNIQPFNVQCLLPINIYNEKVKNYIFYRIFILNLDFLISLVLACICCYYFNLWSSKMAVLFYWYCSNKFHSTISTSK